MTREKTAMPNENFFYLVDQARDLGAKTISVFGYGEPLTDRDIVKKVEYCTKMGLDTFITSNGSLLNIDLGYALLDAGLTHIRFSVHGFYKTYNKVHRGLNFESVLRKIGNFNAVSKLRKGTKVSISCIPMNNEDIEDIKNLWTGYELEIWKPHDWAGGRNYREVKARKKTCGRPHKGPVQINADGNMMVCCYDFDGKMVVGDTYQNTIEEILKGEKFNLIRRCHETGRLDGLPCESCDQLNEGDEPLLYSTVDPECKPGKTSSTKFSLE